METEINDNWGGENLSSRDLVIPKLALMQSISKEVKAERCRAGDIVENTTKRVIAKRGEKLPFVVFQHWREMWVVQGPKGNEKIVGRFEATPDLENLPWKDVDASGQAFSRQLVLCFHVLLTNDIDGLPCRIYFTKTSLTAGKILATELAILQRKKRPPAAKVFLLGVELKVKDSNDFYAFTVTPERDAEPAEIGAARTWHGTLSVPTLDMPPGHGDLKAIEAVPAALTGSVVDDGEEVPF